MESSEIYKALSNYFSDGYTYQMENVYLYNWESDFFCLNREGYAFEFEVKVSRGDFKADFKKDKHKLFIDNPGHKVIPNRFYYAVPADLIKEREIPAYAGLIYVYESHAQIIKRAPFLHKKKYDFRRKLCDKFYYQWMTMKRKLYISEAHNERLKKQIEYIGETPVIQ